MLIHTYRCSYWCCLCVFIVSHRRCLCVFSYSSSKAGPGKVVALPTVSWPCGISSRCPYCCLSSRFISPLAVSHLLSSHASIAVSHPNHCLYCFISPLAVSLFSLYFSSCFLSPLVLSVFSLFSLSILALFLPSLSLCSDRLV